MISREKIDKKIKENHEENLAIDIYALCESVGVDVWEADEIDMYDSLIFGELSPVIERANLYEIILKQDGISPYQKRYITAFLLSHYILHVLNDNVYSNVFRYYPFMRLKYTHRRIRYMDEAHDFALRNILLPRDKLRRNLDMRITSKHFDERYSEELKQIDAVKVEIKRVSRLFKVKEKVLYYRLGMIT